MTEDNDELSKYSSCTPNLTLQELAGLKELCSKPQQQTQYVGLKEFERLQEDKRRKDLADEQAYLACSLLRKQLAEDEMQRRLSGCRIANGKLVYEEVPFQFSTKEQYKLFAKEHTGIWV